jgi:hypothetical protein
VHRVLPGEEIAGYDAVQSVQRDAEERECDGTDGGGKQFSNAAISSACVHHLGERNDHEDSERPEESLEIAEERP